MKKCLNKDFYIGSSNTKLESLIPYVLFNNNDGTKSFPITLSDNYSNYKYIDIVYGEPLADSYGVQTKRVYIDLTLKVWLDINLTAGYWGNFYGIESYFANDNKFYKVNEFWFGGNNGAIYNWWTVGNSSVVIYKMIGYK